MPIQIAYIVLHLLPLFLFFLTVDSPNITQHSEKQSVATGNDIDFWIKATGDSLQFQWQKNGTNLTDGDKYQGVHTDTLHIAKVDKGDKGLYQCLVKNDVERKVSDEAHLSVSKLLIDWKLR